MGYYYPNGLSDKAGAHRLLTLPIYTSSQVVYVDSNAVSGGNGSYNRPYQTNTAADGVAAFIVVKDGSAEVLSGAPTTSANRTVVGEVSAGGVPSASLTVSYAGDISSSVLRQQWVNMTFPAPTVATGSARFTPAAGARFVDCRLEEDSVSGEIDIYADGAGSSLEGCTFVSTAAAAATAPDSYALRIDADGLRIIDCVFDDGAYGRTSNNGGAAAYGGNGDSAVRVYGANLLRSAKISAGGAEATAFEGIVNIDLATQGGAFIDNDEIYTLHPAGISDALGDRLLTSDPIYASGEVYYVDSVNGDDSTGDGSPETPYATLVAAWAAIGAAEAVIVLRAGHSEVLSSVLDIDEIGATIIGEGDPSDSSNCATLDITIGLGLTVSAVGCEVRNVRFEANGAIASPLPACIVTGESTAFCGCYYELGVDPNISGLALTANYTRAEDCQFVNVATTEAARPYGALGHGTSSLNGLLFKDCTIDGGTTGYTSWGLDCDSGGAITAMRGENIILLNGADAKIHEDSTGYCQITSSDTSKVEAF